MQPTQCELQNRRRGIVQPLGVVNSNQKFGFARAATKKLSQRNSNVALLQLLSPRILQHERDTQRTALRLRKSADLIMQLREKIT
jgi:hypothetical protein